MLKVILKFFWSRVARTYIFILTDRTTIQLSIITSPILAVFNIHETSIWYVNLSSINKIIYRTGHTAGCSVSQGHRVEYNMGRDKLELPWLLFYRNVLSDKKYHNKSFWKPRTFLERIFRFLNSHLEIYFMIWYLPH